MGKGNINWVPNPKKARLNKGKLSQENLMDRGQANEEFKLKESKEVNINK